MGVVNSGKAVEVTCSLQGVPNGLFNKLTLVAVLQTALDALPIVYKVESQEVTGVGTYTFVHSSNEADFEIPYSTFLQNSHPFRTNKTFSSKDGILLAGNIKSDSFNIGYDVWNTRIIRYREYNGQFEHNLQVTGNIYNIPYNDESGRANGFRPGGTLNDWYTEDQYIYDSNGIVGGQSIDGSIRFKFVLKEFVGDESFVNAQTSRIDNPGETALTGFQDGYDYVNKSFDNFNSPFVRGFMGYKREEIYRFGIVGFEKVSGNPSFVLALGDIKMPSISTDAGYETIPGTGITTFPIARKVGSSTLLYSLGIQFEINLPSAVADLISHYVIVRVPRDEKNSTRKCSGVIQKLFHSVYMQGEDAQSAWIPTSDICDIENYYQTGVSVSEYQGGGFGFYYHWNLQNKTDSVGSPTAAIAGVNYLMFYSPEFSYQFKQPSGVPNDYLKVVGILSETHKQNLNGVGDDTPLITGGRNVWGNTYTKETVIAGLPGFIPINGTSSERRQFMTRARATQVLNTPDAPLQYEKIKSAEFIYGGAEGSITGSNIPIANIGTEHSRTLLVGANTQTFSGRGLLINFKEQGLLWEDEYNTGEVDGAPYQNYRGKAFLMDYIRLITEQYGGIGEEALSKNTFIECSSLIQGNQTINVFDGDVFVTLFQFFKNFHMNSMDNESGLEWVIFPVETKLNLEITSGRKYTEDIGGFDHDDDGIFQVYRSQEDGNKYGSIFLYNPVYSATRVTHLHFTKPLLFTEVNEFDYRVYVSDTKINGEDVDAWAKFGINSFFDVQSRYGAITRLITLRNEVIALQETGVGAFSINPRAVVNTSDNVPTELGTSKGVQRFDYLSTTNGCIHQFSVVEADSAIYWYDGIAKKILRYSGNGKENLSELKGLDSFLAKNLGTLALKRKSGGDNPLEGKGCHAVYDAVAKEVWFTFLGTETIYTTGSYEELQNPYVAGQIVEIDGDYYLVPETFQIPVGPGGGLLPLQTIKNILKGRFTLIEDFNPNFTLVYSELGNAFTHFYKWTPPIYIKAEVEILSQSGSNVFIHSKGSWNVIYGSTVESSITFIANAPVNTILEHIEYTSIAKDALGNHIDEGITHIRVKNDYQDSGKVAVNQKFKFRKWRIIPPRNESDRTRMRGNYHEITLYFSPGQYREISIGNIIVNLLEAAY